MTTVSAVTCNGCGNIATAPGKIYPHGWLRLTVTGRKRGADRVVGIATVDICGPRCADKALEEPFVDLGEPYA